MKLLYLSDILNVHDKNYLEQFCGASIVVKLCTFFHREERLPQFLNNFDIKISHTRYSTYPDGYKASNNRLIRHLTYVREEKEALSEVKKEIDEFKPDVVFAQWALTGGYLAALSGFKPTILFAWGSDVLILPFSNPFYTERVIKSLTNANIVLFSAKHVMNAAKVLTCNSIKHPIFLPCELDSNKFKPLKENVVLKKDIQFERCDIIISTRPLKILYGIDILIRAFAKMSLDYPMLRLLIVGEGEELHNLISLTESLNIKKRVLFKGFVLNEDLIDFLSVSSFYVSCSYSESTSLGMLEAMSCGLPAILSDNPSSFEWVDEGINGFIFKRGNVESLSDKLVKMMLNKKNWPIYGKENICRVKMSADRNKNFPVLLSHIQKLIK